MRKFVNLFYEVRKDEWLSAGLMFLLHGMLMATFYFLKPARDSLFLSEVGPRQLPFVYLLLAAVAIPVSIFMSKNLRHHTSRKVLQGSLGFFIVTILILRWLFILNVGWIYTIFYIWVGIFGILVISQFWLYANALFNAAQSKRLFSFLNLGAILGAIAGSQASTLFVAWIDLSTQDLLFVSAGLLGLCMGIIYFIDQKEDAEEQEELEPGGESTFAYSSRDVVKTVFQSRYQLLIAGIIGIAMLVSTLVDYQFKSLASEAYTNTAALTSFLGTFYGALSVVSLLIQILLSAQIIKKLGLGGAILTRPASILVGAALFLFEPVLAVAIYMQGFDRATRYSIDKTGRELLFLPLPQRVKKKTKIFMDIFVDRLFRGIAGLLLLAFIYIRDFTVEQVSYIVIAAIAVWIFIAFWARKEYVNTFRNSISKRYINLDKISLNLNESVAYRAIKEMLESGSATRIIYGLRLLNDSQTEKVSHELKELLSHSHSEVRLRALKLLQHTGGENLTSQVEPLLEDPEPEIRLEAVYYLCRHSKDEPEEAMQYYLKHENDELKSAALGCIHVHGEGEGPEIEERFIKKVVNKEGDDSVVLRAQMAQLLGHVSDRSKAVKYLKELLQHDESVVVRKTLESIQKLQDDEFLDDLFVMLKHSDFSGETQRVLASYGTDYFALFEEKFTDGSVELEIRRKMPGIFSHVPKQQSVDSLIRMMEQSNPALRYHVIKTLNNLKKDSRSLTLDEEKIRTALQAEARQYFELLSTKMVQRTDIPNNILIIAIKEKMDQTIERLFRLAGLLNDQQDLHGSYLVFVSSDQEASAASVEFIDNILDEEERKYIFPIIDSLEEEEKLEKGREFFELPVDSYEKGMLELLEGDDLWLKACALFSVSVTCPEPLKEHVQQSASDENSPLIKETAEYVLKRNSWA